MSQNAHRQLGCWILQSTISSEQIDETASFFVYFTNSQKSRVFGWAWSKH